MRNILLVIWCCITFFNADIFAKSQDKINQVIYLSNGKMYCCDISKKSTDQLPINSDTVENFSLSPTKRYLAYEKVIKYVDLYYEIDSEDEIPTKTAISSIVIYDLIEHKKIAEVLPKEDEYLGIIKWTDNNKLHYVSRDQLSVNGWLILNTTGVIEDLGGYEESTAERSVVYSRDKSIKLYIDKFADLHMINLRSMKDTKLYSSPNNLLDYNISSNKKSVVWFEVVDSKSDAFDKISLLSLVDMKQTEIYNEKALPKNEKCISFSPDDSIVTVELGEDVIILLNIFTKEKQRINGHGVCWIDSNSFIYNKNSDLYLYNIKNNSDTLFVKDAKRAECIN